MHGLRALATVLGLIPTLALGCAVDPASTSDFPDSVVFDAAAGTDGPYRAWFHGATTRYDHGILGDAVEPSVLGVMSTRGPLCGTVLRLDDNHVFEDIAPRLADVTGDGRNEIIVVRTHLAKGAQLAIYHETADGQVALLAATPYIGRRHRWLAPIGAADLDGDGSVEIAYIDRPHLAKTLRIWRYRDGRLSEVASATGLTNHRIGEGYISGGIRDCGQGPELITADAGWSRIMATWFDNGSYDIRALGPHAGPDSFARALACES